jgi:hypothetical protein
MNYIKARRLRPFLIFLLFLALRIPVESDHRFRSKVGHPFRSKLDQSFRCKLGH